MQTDTTAAMNTGEVKQMAITNDNWKDIRAAEEMIEDRGAKVMLLLTVEDVQEVVPGISDERAMEVLHRMYHKEEYDWQDAVQCAADSLGFDDSLNREG